MFEERNTLACKTVGDPSLSPVSREQYRQLAATLHNAQAASGVKAVMIASAVEGEGKTLTAANLALTFAESYRRRVLLIDADLRKPSLGQMFGGDTQGSMNAAGSGSWTEDVREVTPRLGILTRVGPTSDPMAELTSARIQRLIHDARESVDWVVVDTPPIALLPDASLLSGVVDGAVLVIKAGSTPLDLVRRAVDALNPGKMLGVVLNAASRQPRAAQYGYGYEPYGRRVKPD